MTSRDFPLPISDDASASSAWPAVRQEPVNYIAVVPRSKPPQQHEVIEALSREGGAGSNAADQFTVVDTPDPQSPAIWNALIAGPAWPSPIVTFVEPMRELAPETIEFLKVGECTWAIGFETILPFDEPHNHLLRLLRMVARAFPDSPAILNVNTGAWHTREELDSTLLPAEMETSPALAFIVHAIAAEADEGGGSPAPPPIFAYTDGMHVIGRAELEMHGIAVEDGRIAAGFLNSVAELIVENGLPEPGQPFEIGVDLFVRFMPASEAAAAANPKAFGNPSNRVDHAQQPLDGERIAVCALDSLSWPANVARQIQRGEAAMMRSKAATERDARIARKTLDQFAALFASVPAAKRRDSNDRIAAFLVKACFAVPRGSIVGNHAHVGDDHREHLWFEASEVHNGRVRGTLLNEPTFVRLRQGDLAWIDRNVVSDWQVFTPKGQFGPMQHHVAKTTIEQLLALGAEKPHG